MPTSFAAGVQSRFPEDIRKTPLVTIRRVATSNGAVDGTTLVDSYLQTLADSPIGLTLVRKPDDLVNFEVRQITDFDVVTGTCTPGTAFTSQIQAGEVYAISTVSKFGGLTVPLSSILQPISVNGSVGPSNYNAAPVTVVDYSAAGTSYIAGLYLDVSDFTNGATLTATVKIKMGVSNTQRQYQLTFVKSATATLFVVVGPEIPFKGASSGLSSAFVVELQSNNAGDNARTCPFSYFVRQTD